MFVRQQYRREYGKGLPHKKPIASETDACKMKSFARLGGLKEAPASIGGEYFTFPKIKTVFFVFVANVNKRLINSKWICIKINTNPFFAYNL